LILNLAGDHLSVTQNFTLELVLHARAIFHPSNTTTNTNTNTNTNATRSEAIDRNTGDTDDDD